jgi:hypothetical protein
MHNLPGEPQLTVQQELEIELLAEGLTEEEVCMYLFGESYTSLGGEFLRRFNRAHCRGRTKMKLLAITALKDQMKTRNGLQASLAVLTRFAEAFPKIADSDGNINGAGFSFRVEMDD